MSQMQPEVVLNLKKFARYMKSSLTFAFFSVFGVICVSFIVFLALSFGMLIFIGFLLFAVAVGLIIFQILQLSSLFRAKNASSDPLLSQSFYLRLGALITLGVSILFIFDIDIMLILVCLNHALTRFGYHALHKFTEKNFSTTKKAHQGCLLFSISVFIGIGFSFGVLLSYHWVAVNLYFLGVILSFFIAIIGQLILANGFLDAFTTDNSLEASSSPHKDLTEPTFQTYGVSLPNFQPSDLTSLPFSSSSLLSTSDGLDKLKICPTCGTSLMDGAKFCSTCGSNPTPILQPSDSTHHPPSPSSPLSDGVGKIKICTMCGTSLMDGAKFCSHCGLNQ